MTYLVTFKFDLRCVEVSDGEVARLRGEEDVGVRSIRVADVVIQRVAFDTQQAWNIDTLCRGMKAPKVPKYVGTGHSYRLYELIFNVGSQISLLS